MVTGTSSVLTISTDLLGDLTLIEKDPLLAQTAYGVLADLIEVARLKRDGGIGRDWRS
jgi:homoserine dehydrogenase